MSALPRSINLLPPSEFESSFWGKFLKWAVTTGRYIIILTELVVILAFLSRFKLDEDLRNIDETIRGQMNFLEGQMPLEQRFRTTQAKINTIGAMIKGQLGAGKNMEKIGGLVPDEVKLERVSAKPGLVVVSGVSTSERAIGELVLRTEGETTWGDVKLTEFLTEDGNEMKFTFEVPTTTVAKPQT